MTKPAVPGKMKITDLTPAARAAVEQKAVTGGWDGKSLGKLLSELDRWDQMAEVRKAHAQKIFMTGAIGCVVGFFLFFVVAFMVEAPLVALGLAAIPVAILITGIRMKRAARAIDLPNELRISLRPMIRQLSQDLHPDERIKVTLNLAGIDEKKANAAKDLPPGRNRSLKQNQYDEDICLLRIPLLDGSEAVLHLSNTYFKLVRSYTTSRGKYKSKTKWKKLTSVTAMLVPPVRISWEPASMQQHIDRRTERLSFVEKNGVMVARLDRYYKFKAANEPPADAAPAADILKMFVRLTAMRPRAAGGLQ
ncbi:MAG TPA: hypothetical protein VFQ91_10855 [Bryobacteraceae bacterium]|nr:hypothetical protein [Bryobacteraceae bacterium]